MTDFADELHKLTSREAVAAQNDPERIAFMFERLAAALGFTAAIACRGDARAIDQMLAGAEAYAHAEAVEKAPLIRSMVVRS